MDEVLINKYSTYFKIRVNTKNGIILNSSSIPIRKFVRNKLAEYWYDDKLKTFVPKYYYLDYDMETGTIKIPVNLITKFTQYVLFHGGKYKIISEKPNESDLMNIKFKTDKFNDRDNQTSVIEFFTNNKNPMRALRLQTGIGKTYCAIKAATILNKKTLVVVPGFLTNQWIKEIKDKTYIKDDEIVFIQGSKSIISIINNSDLIKRAKIYVASSKTLIQYISKTFDVYNSIIPFEEFIKILKIGTKILDECHLHFHINTIIDLNCNIENNLYLSASYVRSNKSGNRIFNNVFPEYIKYNNKRYQKYVKIVECQYDIGFIHPMATKTKRGYSQIKYEKYLCRNTLKLEYLYKKVFYKLIENYFISVKKPKQKLLIFINTRDIGYKLCNIIKKEYPNLVVSVYFNDTKDIVLEKSDIIISTTGSCGVGKDIKDLKTVLLFSSFISESLCYQTLGRLRRLKDDTPIFVFMQNTNIEGHMHHLYARRMLYKTLCKEYETIKL